MIRTLNQTLLVLSNSMAASIVVKATVAATLGLSAVWLARGSRAALRHTLLAATFGALLLLPIASALAPRIRVVVPAPSQPATAPPAIPMLPDRLATREPVPSRAVAISDVLLSVWALGAAVFLVPVAIGLWQIRSMRRSALPWRELELRVAVLVVDAGMRRRVKVLRHESLSVPMTCGIVHPAIVFPASANTWSGEDLDRALVHELEHVRRGDWATHCVARALCALYWFHPLVWTIWRRLELEAERSCDDAVLTRSEATAYAEQLVGLAQQLSATTKAPLLAMASRADLAARVGAVLDHRLRRGRAGRLPVALACAAAAVLAIAISPLAMVAAPQAADSPIGRFAVRTGLVMVTVTVSDSSGWPIEGLTANDFILTEDGVPQKISIFDFQRVAGGIPNPPTSYYVLGYYTNANGDGRFRKLEVTRSGDPTAKLTFRAGYTVAPPPAAPQVAPGSLHPIMDATAPQVLFKREPEYSEEARKAKYQGTVLLNVQIDDTGHVAAAKVVRSLGLGLDEKAAEAVKQWRFRPAIKNGQPVTVWTEVEVTFRLL
jgi:TonB family protein